MANKNLAAAKSAKNDEFYTQYADIQKEVNAYVDYDSDVFRGKTVLCPCDDPEWSNFTKFFAKNFDRFGLKKLISTSYAYDSKTPKPDFDWQPTLFESDDPAYDTAKSPKHGKIFTLTDQEEPPRDIDKLKWSYLEGDGDFRSDELLALLKEADIVVTNPPFSLFREFITWIFSEKKQFLVIGNKNCVAYKEIFPLIKDNKLWTGKTEWSGGLWFETPETRAMDGAPKQEELKNVSSVWFTNLEHGRRHKKLEVMTYNLNLENSRHTDIREAGYQKYDNYDAIEVPYTDAIPSDYEGVMGVPISFLDKYCPEQFAIVGITKTWFGLANKIYPEQLQIDKNGKKSVVTKLNDGAVLKLSEEPHGETFYRVGTDMYQQVYARILIRHKNLQKK